jgi:hypothetical protein
MLHPAIAFVYANVVINRGHCNCWKITLIIFHINFALQNNSKHAYFSCPMEYSPSWECNQFSASQKISLIL